MPDEVKLTILRINKPLVMLPYVICESARLESDGELFSIRCFNDGRHVSLFASAVPFSGLNYRGVPCGLDIEIGEFTPCQTK
jgi:hypothetical protein